MLQIKKINSFRVPAVRGKAADGLHALRSSRPGARRPMACMLAACSKRRPPRNQAAGGLPTPLLASAARPSTRRPVFAACAGAAAWGAGAVGCARSACRAAAAAASGSAPTAPRRPPRAASTSRTRRGCSTCRRTPRSGEPRAASSAAPWCGPWRSTLYHTLGHCYYFSKRMCRVVLREVHHFLIYQSFILGLLFFVPSNGIRIYCAAIYPPLINLYGFFFTCWVYTGSVMGWTLASLGW